jgi:hypothetical protein
VERAEGEVGGSHKSMVAKVEPIRIAVVAAGRIVSRLTDDARSTGTANHLINNASLVSEFH